MALAINERFLLGKSKEWVGCSRYLMIALVENDNWEEIVGRCHAHGGTEFSIGSCIPIKYTNQGKPSGSSFHQKSFPYWPKYFSLTIHSGSYGLGPLVTKIIPDFAGFFNDFCWKYEHTSYYISSNLTGIFLLAAYTLAHRDPSSGLTEILFFFFLCYYYYLFLFSSFWDFGPSWSFLTSWIGHSFVKAHGLSLLFMEWAIM